MYSIGIDIGGMSIKIGIVDADGSIIAHKIITTDPDKGYALMVADMAEAVKTLCEANSVKNSDLRGIGVGIPGIADSKAGIVRVAINLNWRNVLLVSEFQKYFPIPIKINNDANCAALGEQRFGGGRGYDNIIFITIGTGVGSGMIVEGKIVEGAGSAGAESGHMVIEMDGEPCNCGRKGCWEAYASASALIRQTKLAMEKNPTSKLHEIAKKEGKVSGKTAFRAADMGDVSAKLVVDEYLGYVTTGLINLTNILHPDAFIIGGGVSHEGANLILPLQKNISSFIEKSGMYPDIKVVSATLGNHAGIIGASALV